MSSSVRLLVTNVSVTLEPFVESMVGMFGHKVIVCRCSCMEEIGAASFSSECDLEELLVGHPSV